MKPTTFILAILLWTTTLLAQKEISNYNKIPVDKLSYFSTTLSQDDGLSQGSNYFRYEDSKGFMWITGNDAVNRYDGAMVKVYNLDKYFDQCPNLQQGYGFAEDEQSNIYIGSVHGLYIYHRAKDKFTLQKMYSDSADAVAMPFAYSKGKVWCFNKKYQLATYDVQTKKIEQLVQLPLAPLPSVNVYQLPKNMFYFHMPMMDKHGIIYATSDDDMVSYNTLTKQIQKPLEGILAKHHFSFFATCYDTINNTIWIGTDNGIIQYDANTKQHKHITQVAKQQLKFVNGIGCSKNFIACNNVGKVLLFNNNFTQSQELKLPYFANSYLTIQFGFDKNERLWMCANGKGQIIVDFTSKLLHKGTADEALFHEFKQLGITRFAEMPDGNICMPAVENNNKLKSIILNTITDEKTLVDFPFKPSDANLLLATDTMRKGVWFFSQEMTKNFANLIVHFLDANYKMYESRVNSKQGLLQNVKVLSNNKILCAFEKGLCYYNTQTKQFDSIVGGMQKNAFVISTLSNSNVAVSYLNNDMLIYKLLPSGNVQAIKNILPGIQSFYLAEDVVNHRYWVGTNQGVYLLDSTFKFIKKIDANNGLAGTYIYGILLGDDGNIYCSHQRGLSSINGTTFQIINFDKSDGIQDWDFHNRSFYKASDGTLCFGGTLGFNYFKPPLFRASKYKPEVYIDEILVNNNPFSITQNAAYIKQLNLDYNQNNIVIKAIVKDLVNAQSLQITYRFKNKETAWHYLPNNSKIIFNSLAPDEYILQIGYFDKYANKEIIQKEIEINIATPFYKSIWFWALMAIGFTASVFWSVNKKKQGKQKREFEKQLALINQRNRITADLHDDIGATLSSLQLNSTIAHKGLKNEAINTSEILKTIETQAKELSEKVGDIIWSLKGEDAFGKFSDRIKTYTNQILDYSPIEYKINIDNRIDDFITDSVMKKNLILLSKEAINNAVKYSKANLLIITCNLKDQHIYINFKDDGIGFETKSNKGNGLKNMKQRVEELHGSIEINSKPNEGTEIEILIPIGFRGK